jgi:hypothetical protein
MPDSDMRGRCRMKRPALVGEAASALIRLAASRLRQARSAACALRDDAQRLRSKTAAPASPTSTYPQRNKSTWVASSPSSHVSAPSLYPDQTVLQCPSRSVSMRLKPAPQEAALHQSDTRPAQALVSTSAHRSPVHCDHVAWRQ